MKWSVFGALTYETLVGCLKKLKFGFISNIKGRHQYRTAKYTLVGVKKLGQSNILEEGVKKIELVF